MEAEEGLGVVNTVSATKQDKDWMKSEKFEEWLTPRSAAT